MVDSKFNKSSRDGVFHTDESVITIQDLNNILEANQKALTIYLEVEKQNEELIERIVENRVFNEKLSDRIQSVDETLKEQGHSGEIDRKVSAELLTQLTSMVRENKREIELNRAVGEKIRETIFSIERSIVILEESVENVKDDFATDKTEISETLKEIDDGQKEILHLCTVITEVKSKTSDVDKKIADLDKKIGDIDKSFFRLMILLGGSGLGIIIQIAQTFLRK